MSDQQARIIPFRHPSAPRCEKCQRRMTLAQLQLDPNGGRYMFEMFECRGCETCQLKVRPIQTNEQSQTAPAVRRFAGRAPSPGRHETG